MPHFLVHTFFYLLLLTQFDASRTQSVIIGTNTSSLRVQEREETRRTHEVQFHYRIEANRKGHLICEVSLSSEARQTVSKFGNRSLSHVYLRCPQVAVEICYVDCSPACVYDEVDGCVVPSSLSTVIKDCQFEYIKESAKILLDYTIAIEALDRTGDWNCEYRGISASRSLKLQASPKSPSTTTFMWTTASTTATFTSTTASIPVRTIVKTNLPPNINQVGPKSGRIKTAQSAHQTENEENERGVLWMLTRLRPEIILALIVLTVAAIALNIALSVRCSMTKCYFDYLRQGNPDPCLGRCLCFEQSSSTISPSTKCHHHENQPYGLMIPPPPLRPPPTAFYAPYHQPDQQSDSSGLMPPYTRQISFSDATTARLLAGQHQQQQPPGTLSTTSSTDTAGTLPVQYPGKRDSIEIGSMASDLCSQTKVYLFKVTDPNSTDHQQINQKSRTGASLNSNVYEEESSNTSGREAFHTTTPTLIRLSGSTEPAGLILCHRLADVGSDLSKNQPDADFVAVRHVHQPIQNQSCVLLSTQNTISY